MAKKRGLNGLGSTSLLLLAGGALALWLLMKPEKKPKTFAELPREYLVGADGKKTELARYMDSLYENDKAGGLSAELAEQRAVEWAWNNIKNRGGAVSRNVIRAA
jgi:hypothetical protein